MTRGTQKEQPGGTWGAAGIGNDLWDTEGAATSPSPRCCWGAQSTALQAAPVPALLQEDSPCAVTGWALSVSPPRAV